MGLCCLLLAAPEAVSVRATVTQRVWSQAIFCSVTGRCDLVDNQSVHHAGDALIVSNSSENDPVHQHSLSFSLCIFL